MSFSEKLSGSHPYQHRTMPGSGRWLIRRHQSTGTPPADFERRDIVVFPQPVLEDCYRAATAISKTLRRQIRTSKSFTKSRTFRANAYAWLQVAELGFDSSRYACARARDLTERHRRPGIDSSGAVYLPLLTTECDEQISAAPREHLELYTIPRTRLILLEQASGRIRRAVVAVEQPAPIRRVRQ